MTNHNQSTAPEVLFWIAQMHHKCQSDTKCIICIKENNMRLRTKYKYK